MTYHLPEPLKCDKCGFEMNHSQDLSHPAPRIDLGDEYIICCPKCWIEWVKSNIGRLQRRDKYHD